MGVRHVLARRLYFVAVLVSLVVVFQCFAFPSWRIYPLLDADKGSNSIALLPFGVSSHENAGKDVYRSTVTNAMPNFMNWSDSEDDADENGVDFDSEFESDGDGVSRKGEVLNEDFEVGKEKRNDEDAIHSFAQKRPKYAPDALVKARKIEKLGTSESDLLITGRKSLNGSGMHSVEMQAQIKKPHQLKASLSGSSNKSKMGTSSVRKKSVSPTSVTEMNSLLLQSFNSSYMRSRLSSRRDRELLSAKLEIENARVVSNSPKLYAPIFRDVYKFSRSYELMERKLKVYVYSEGEKPIFHQPKMRGIYASEGWFMKLMEGNKRFVVKDPRKAHLFYLPFSSLKLRITLSEQNLHGTKHMQQYLERYVGLIAGKYRFWNRTDGADHFLVACHDWASQITREPMKNCIRSLCNSNIAKGFQIGKDTTLPATYIHSMMDPSRGFSGKPPSERSILAFFAGGMHGYLRPILLKHWQNKELDMKIFGQMPRDLEGKRIYREYMNTSKYCICARGYEVHSPRIIEAIFSECVPVIISDNYVPPLFEVLNWEAFSVFVREKDIPNLRDILVSIPEEKYLSLHLGVKKVQQHFQWHKVPAKYDLFHMILHSVWNNRLSQIRPR